MLPRNGTSRINGALDCRTVEAIGIRESGLVSNDSPHADSLICTIGTTPDDTVLHRPRLVSGRLKVQISVVEPTFEQSLQQSLERRDVQASRLEQPALNTLERRLLGAFDCH
jgi:hypothetical protein